MKISQNGIKWRLLCEQLSISEWCAHAWMPYDDALGKICVCTVCISNCCFMLLIFRFCFMYRLIWMVVNYFNTLFVLMDIDLVLMHLIIVFPGSIRDKTELHIYIVFSSFLFMSQNLNHGYQLVILLKSQIHPQCISLPHLKKFSNNPQ